MTARRAAAAALAVFVGASSAHADEIPSPAANLLRAKTEGAETEWSEWYTVPTLRPKRGLTFDWRIWIPDPMTVELRRHGAELRSRIPESPEKKGRVVLIEDDGELVGIRNGEGCEVGIRSRWMEEVQDGD